MKKLIMTCTGSAVVVLSLCALGASQPDKQPEKKPLSWNDSSVKMIEGKWAAEKGMDALQSFPPTDAKGYDYAKDFMKWASFFLKDEYLPKEAEQRVIPLRMGSAVCLGSIPPENLVTGKDGLTIRYGTDEYVIQLDDTLYDFRILVLDLKREKKDYTTEEKTAFGRQWMQKLLHPSLVTYPDKSERKLWTKEFPTHLYAQWNWRTTDKANDDARSGTSSTNDPYSCFMRWRTDGCSILFSIVKEYGVASVGGPWAKQKESRFNDGVRFRDKEKPQE